MTRDGMKRLAIEVGASVCTIAGLYFGTTTLPGAVWYAVGLLFWFAFVFMRGAWGLLPLNIASTVVTAIHLGTLLA